MTIRRLSTQSPDFAAELKNLLALEAEQDAGIERTVVEILADIRQRGDAALLDYTRKFDRLDVHDAHHLELPQTELQSALQTLSHDQRS
jgi:histidinol dehydrogenase